jgi:hypothetical protein
MEEDFENLKAPLKCKWLLLLIHSCQRGTSLENRPISAETGGNLERGVIYCFFVLKKMKNPYQCKQ